MKAKILGLVAVGLLAMPFHAPIAEPRTISATGVINGYGIDDAGVFGTIGTSLLGLPYSITITTDPLLNSVTACASLSCLGTIGGNAFGSGTGAPYSIAVTVNGVSYTQAETNPFLNHSYLIDALSIGDTTTTLQDQAYQGVQSNGCFSVYPACTDSYILAYSTATTFVPSLDFNQSITASSGLDPGSNTWFSFQDSSGRTTKFYGSIQSLVINADPTTLLGDLLAAATNVGPGSSLADKVALAQTYYAVPDVPATCAVLIAFGNEVLAQRGKKLTAEFAADLAADAQAIVEAIGCN